MTESVCPAGVRDAWAAALAVPHLLLPLPTQDGFDAHDTTGALRLSLRLLGALLCLFSLTYLTASLHPRGARSLYVATVVGRLLATPVVALFVWWGGMPLVMQLGTATDAVGALWTWRCIRRDEEDAHARRKQQ